MKTLAKRPIAILGAGNAATALAVLLSRHPRPIHLYCIEPDVEKDINLNACNTKYLTGLTLSPSIRAFPDLPSTVRDADVVIVAVPSFAIQSVLHEARGFFAKDAIFASITKGLDPKTLRPLAVEAANALPPNIGKRLCVIAGPAVANELALGQPAAFCIAGKDPKARKILADLFHSHAVKISTSPDLYGAGLCMALKNVYAILLGMCDGLHYPMNSKSLLVALAIEEMETILRAAKADPDTAAGLAGLGDLLVTGFSPHGRNRRYGEALVGSKTSDPKKLGLGTIEGIAASQAAKKLLRQLRVEAPLLKTAIHCLSQKNHFEKPFVRYLQSLRLH